jgi:transcriptional regulator with XRE-family HTH domain
MGVLLLYCVEQMLREANGGEIVYINLEKFKNLINTNFENNLHQCARELEVSPSTVYRIVNGNSNAGAKFLGSLMNYCKVSEIDFNEYIFLTKPLRATNDSGDFRHLK